MRGFPDPKNRNGAQFGVILVYLYNPIPNEKSNV
jgi:hypothetical protein